MIREHFCIFISAILFILGTFLFVKGYRDVDTALNLVIVKQTTGIEFKDETLTGIKFTILELYKIGLSELFFSFVLLFSSFGFLMIALFQKIERVREWR